MAVTPLAILIRFWNVQPIEMGDELQSDYNEKK